ncbi:MAG: TetR family transcriptional regulator [Myxococcota bacterium]
MPRPKNTDQRRHQIVQALCAVMAEVGFESASVTRIAQAAGLTPGLVHYHFKTKEEILLTLVSETTSGGQARIARCLESASTARDRVYAYLQGVLALGEGPGGFSRDESSRVPADHALVRSWTLIGAQAVRNPAVRALYQPFVEHVHHELAANLVDARRQAGQRVDDEGAAAMAAALVATCEGYLHLSAAAPGLIPRGTAFSMARRMADGLIDAGEPAAGTEGGAP